MNYRLLGRTGMKVSEISFGAWAIGASWGQVDDKESLAALHKAVDLGVNFFDTADVYGNGRSERLIGKLLRERSETIYVATKAGRKLSPHVAEKYTPLALRKFVEQSLKNLRVEALDLLQLHCPPTQVYYTPELFAFLDQLVKAGKLKNYGVSVEKVEEALKAIAYPGVKTVQIIFNMFRQRPAELFFREAKSRWVGIITRVPLASGMLTGRMSRATRFRSDDHRAFNRKGKAFDRGETFSGVDYPGAGGRGGAAPDHAAEHDDVAVRPALDPHARCGQLRHPRGQTADAGGGELPCGGPPAALPGSHAPGGGHLPEAHPRRRSPAVVGG